MTAKTCLLAFLLTLTLLGYAGITALGTARAHVDAQNARLAHQLAELNR